MPKEEKVKVNVKDQLKDNTIDLSLSELTDVPVRDIAVLKRATILDLSNNRIISLGRNFSQLTHITKLDLSKNQIKFLPEDFGRLKSLRHLDLYNNSIEHLPLSFGSLSNLRYLDLKANPLHPELAKIVGPCLTTKDCNESARTTVRYLALRQEEISKAAEKLKLENEAKIEALEELKKADNQKNKKKKNKKGKRAKNGAARLALEINKQKPVYNTRKIVTCERIDPNVKSHTVFKTVLIFFFLLSLNVLMLYIITVKHPDIAEQLVNYISPEYRDVIINGSEKIKVNYLKLSEWIQQFSTPPS